VTVLIWTLVAVLGLSALVWLLLLLQLVVRRGDLTWRVTADRDPEAPTTGPLVSVIIPARNEAGNIGPCIDRVLAQTWTDLEVVVLDDASDDGTADEIRSRAEKDGRVRVVQGQARPDGWMGKVWACNVAQHQARGTVLLFIDADVRLAPEAVRQSRAYLLQNELGALSAFGKLELVTFWEWVVQPVVGGLILSNNDPREVNDPAKKDKVMANGQFIMATREAYDRVGGHASIRGEILDDVSFARRCKAEDVPYHMVYGRELYSCRMYTSLGEIWSGWTKNLFAGLDYRLGATLAICGLLFAMNVLPLIALVWRAVALGMGDAVWTDALLWVAAFNTVAMYVSYVGGLRAADYRIGYFWSYPLGMLVTIGLFANSALRIVTGRGVSWKGRTYTHTGTRQR